MFWIGVVLWCLVGGELGAMAHGATQLDSGSGVVEFVLGINLAPWTAIVAAALLKAGSRRRAGLDAKGPTERTLARVESSRAVSEGPDHLLRLDLTVAPEGRPAYRVDAHARVNVMDLARWEAGRTVVVDHYTEHPWRVTPQVNPDGAWADRAEAARIDSAPEASRQSEPPATRGSLRAYWLLPLLVGAAAYLLLR
ncbi:hypothetical protein [Streptacidiphilus jiangxiensis]|uniref:Uncharacterized protein n=1 Tax=Streptacidiphilus jiangxiensis TaxID=235985 RepID=A0A1H7GDR2_STRJI|nr:hypothetical protein [Streptacidiphilus jiangxiensis]SEK36174.1 hypothetical protein SAMN05414137_101648 [Streptacidiphilus jiangxiensis]